MHFNEIGVTDRSIHYFSSPSDTVRHTYLHTISLGHFYCEAPYFLHRMRYDSFLAALVVDGCLTFRKNNRETSVLPGNLMLLDCWEEHCYYTRESCEFYFFHFDGPSCRPLVELILNNNGNLISPPAGIQFLPTFQTILNMYESNARPSEIDVAIQLYQFLCDVSRIHYHQNSPEQQNGSIDAVIEYIHQHLSEPLSLDELSRIANYSQGHLSRLFRKRTGMSVYHYIMLCRIDKAKHLLHASNDSIHTIGQLAGFPSDANFVRLFSKYTGYLPSTFRDISL